MIEAIENEFLKIEIETAGAELRSIYHKIKKREFLWQGDPEFWPRRAPVLFPIVGKLKGNEYKVDGKIFKLTQHGFARDKEFATFKTNDSKVTFALISDKDSIKVYPFDFELKITYELIQNTLKVYYEVINPGEDQIYFSIGAHPGFICPVNSNEKFEDYYIEFEKEETLSRHLLDEGLFNGKTEAILNDSRILDLNYDLFLKDAIVLKNMRSTYLILKSKSSDHSLKFEFSKFPYFGIWTKPNAPFICLEPWCGIADNINVEGELKEKEGIIILRKGEIFDRNYSITI